MTKSITKIIMKKLVIFILFLILIAVANILIPKLNFSFYSSIIYFIDANLILLSIIMIIDILNEIFWSFYFPFCIPGPITGGILGIYVAVFLYKFWLFINSYLHINYTLPISKIYIIIFLIIMIIGYLIILVRLGRPRDDWKNWRKGKNDRKRDDEEDYENDKDEDSEEDYYKDRKRKSKLEWDDVGDEYKLILYNLGRSINKLFGDDSNKKKK